MKEYRCAFCGEVFNKEDLQDFRDMHEAFLHQGGTFICPDCFADFYSKSLEDQFEILVRGGEASAV